MIPKKVLYFLSLKIDFDLANCADSDVWIFTVCKSSSLGLSRLLGEVCKYYTIVCLPVHGDYP